MTDLTLQRRLASEIMGCSYEKVRFDPESINDIAEAITRADVKGLIGKGIISLKYMPGSSRGRARKIQAQKKKGLRKGHGSRRGTANARADKRLDWIIRIRNIRQLLKNLRDNELITSKIYRELGQKAKGGFFRSIRHLKIYIEEHNLVQKTVQKKN